MNKSLSFFFVAVCVSFGLLAASRVNAQWLTQSVELKPGWNAVYLHVDASHVSLESLLAQQPEIVQVWLWDPPASTLQFVTSPQEAQGGNQWFYWRRNGEGSLTRLVGNAAYLVQAEFSGSTFLWKILGRPMVPNYRWATSGLNFMGFPAVSQNPPSFAQYFASATGMQTAEIYQYVGGALEANPQKVLSFDTTPVVRGQAFWIRSDASFNRYYGPFEIDVSGTRGLDFSNHLSTCSVRLHNLTQNKLNLSVRLLISEPAPAGQPAVAGAPPLLIRGALNPTDLTYAFTNLPVNSLRSWTLPAKGESGSELEVVFGLNRSAISDPEGTLLGGVLRFSDALQQMQIDVPVSASVHSSVGLWVGNAMVNQVGQYLKSYAQERVKTTAPYSSPATNAVGREPVAVLAADFNEDNRIDLLSANASGNTLTLLTNNGYSRLLLASNYPAGQRPSAVAAGDLNGDGRPDLVCVNGSDGTILILTNNGKGVFSPSLPAPIFVGREPAAVKIANIDGNAWPDIVVACRNDNTVCVVTNNGNGGFGQLYSLPVGRTPVALAVADLNRDGWSDIVTVDQADNTLTVFTNNNAAGFNVAASITVGTSPSALAVADLNGDNLPDLICANAADNTLSLLTRTALNGPWTVLASPPVGDGPAAVAVADVNRDGYLDVVSANARAGTLSVLTNNGAGQFQLARTLGAMAGVRAVAAADLTGNQGVDLIAALPSQDALCVFWDQSPVTPTQAPSGAYVVSTINTNLGSVARPFPLRLIIHNPAGSGNAKLLQRVYCGLDAATNPVVATAESALLAAKLSQARRISAPHLPWTQQNQPFDLGGRLGPAARLQGVVTLAADDQASNPFLHTYHPDHDNLNATFDGPALTPESYSIRRQITLEVLPPGNDFNSLTSSGQRMTGQYAETVTLGTNREFRVFGGFVLNRVTDIPVLTTTP